MQEEEAPLACLQSDKMSSTVDTLVEFKQFLKEFCSQHQEFFTSDSPLPLRLQNVYLVESELEGEAIDWTMQYLHLNKCPEVLAILISRAVVDGLQGLDLSEFWESPEEGIVEAQYEPENEDGAAIPAEEMDKEEKSKKESENLPPQLEVGKLCREVFTKVHEVCEKWNRNDLPISEPIPYHNVSVHAIKNTRRKMEDRHLSIPNLELLYKLKDPQSFYAVFDGHGGVDAAIYAASHLHGNMVHNEVFETDPVQALREAFLKTDSDFVKKAQREHIRSGTTGVCSLIRGNKLYVAWLGDSQAMLVRDGQPVELMVPHKPEREDEKKRIEGMGGCVVWFGAWRVNGNLSVSRAIGDSDYKPYISAEPDVAEFDLDGTEDYIVLACDGMWDTITPNQVAIDVQEHITSGGSHAKTAHKLVTLARDRASSDNITVIVVFLRETLGKPKPMAEKKKPQDDDSEKQENNHDEDPNELNGCGDGEGDKESGDNGEGSGAGSEGSKEMDSGGGGGPGDGENTPPANIPSDESGSKEPSEDAIMECAAISAFANQSHKMSDLDMITDRASRESIGPSSHQNSATSAYHNSQNSQNQNSNSQNSAKQESQNSDMHSDASASELALLNQTAHRCLSSRRAKRSRSGKRRNGLKESRRGSKEKALPGLAHRTNGTPPKVRSGSVELRLRESFRASQRSISKTGDHLVELLTGSLPRQISRPVVISSRRAMHSGRWTVAVEIESASAMFEDKLNVRDKKTKTRRSLNL